MVDKAKTDKKSIKFVYKGFALGIVNDIMPEGLLNFAQNVRKSIEGEIESRPVLDNFLTINPLPGTPEVPHTIKSIQNSANSTLLRLIGAGGKIYTGSGSVLNEKDSGYSGSPLTIIDFRPENAIQAYMYIADEFKFVKIGVDNTLSDVGITAPSKAATWKIGAPNRKIIDSIEAGSETDWNNLTGTAAAPTLETRINTTITSYLPDGALPTFASIVPAAFTPDIRRGTIVKLNGAAEVVIEDVLPATLLAGVATISKISYDLLSTGLCTIVLSISSAEIRRDSILKLVNATPTTEYVRVQEVTFDDNGIPSVRVSTVATFAVGNAITGMDSFRIYTAVAYAATNTIIGKYIKSAITVEGVSSITRTFNIDLLTTAAKPLSLEDIFHASLKTSDPAVLTEFQIQLDVGSAGTPFEDNYFYFTISSNFFTGSASQTTPTISIIQQDRQRQSLIDLLVRKFSDANLPNYYFDPVANFIDGPLSQTALGQDQWTELFIPLKNFKRVGEDFSRTFKNVRAIRISVISTAAIDISLDSLWVGGADALETNQQGFLPYNYVWRIRDPATRVFSNWSPPLRTGIKLSRGRVELTFPDAFTTYPVTYKIDIARFGGSLNDFRIVGSIFNDNSTYTDISSDRLIADNDLAGRFSEQGVEDAIFNYFKPFAILDTPKKGVCTIVGTKFTWISGDKLSETYPRGVQIVINGKSNLFYTNPTDDEHVELENDMGSLVSVKFEIEEPLLTGQPLPSIAGIFGEGNLGLFIFGWGDKNAAGTLYWLDGNSPDTMSDTNRLEITSPSEPLIGGVMWDGYLQIFTTKQSFTVLPTISQDGELNFIAKKNAGSRGLFSRYAIDAGPDGIYFLSENADGIYRVRGVGEPELITTGFDNLFFSNGSAPFAVTLADGTIVYPPDLIYWTDLRIFCINDHVIFRFKDGRSVPNIQYVALIFDTKLNAFVSYDMFPNNKMGAWYKEELESNTNVLVGIENAVAKFGTEGTYEEDSVSKVIPFAFDAGDARFLKYFYELMLSIDPGLDGLTIKNLFNNGDNNGVNIVLAGSNPHKRKQFILDLLDPNSEQGVVAQNLATKFEWSVMSGVKLYEEIIYYSPYADEIIDRSSDTITGGNLGEKLWQGIIIQTDTFGEDKILKFLDDENVEKAEITINHDGFITRAYSFDQPFISHTITRFSEDETRWIDPEEVYVFDPEPEAAKVWEGEFNASELSGLILIKRMGIAYRSEAESTLTFFFEDGIEQTYTLPTSTGEFNKEFLYAIAHKWRACKYRIESTLPIRVYKKHCEIDAKSFNSSQGFIKIKPFGGTSNVSEITI